jgi:ABC-type transporter Mla subunit MlaD
MFLGLDSRLRDLERRLTSVLRKINDGAASIRQVLAHAEGLGERLRSASEQTPGLVRRVADQARRLDQAAADFLGCLRDSLARVGGATDELLSGFSRHVFRVHRSILDPALRVSAVLQALAERISGVFVSPRRSPAEFSTDQDIFI